MYLNEAKQILKENGYVLYNPNQMELYEAFKILSENGYVIYDHNQQILDEGFFDKIKDLGNAALDKAKEAIDSETVQKIKKWGEEFYDKYIKDLLPKLREDLGDIIKNPKSANDTLWNKTLPNIIKQNCPRTEDDKTLNFLANHSTIAKMSKKLITPALAAGLTSTMVGAALAPFSGKIVDACYIAWEIAC